MKELTPRQLERALYPDRLFTPETLKVIQAAEKAELDQIRSEAGKKGAAARHSKRPAEQPPEPEKSRETELPDDVTLL